MKIRYVAHIRNMHVFQIIHNYEIIGAIQVYDNDQTVRCWINTIVPPAQSTIDYLKSQAVDMLVDMILLEE